MSVIAWRIVKGKHIKIAFQGTGARRYGGRWNSPGTAVVYTAEHQSLAVLELLAHIERPQLFHDYNLIRVEIPESVISDYDQSTLPANWRSDPPPLTLREAGNKWVRAMSSAVLRVPSTIVPAENNYLLNVNHPDFAGLVIGSPIPFSFDPRLAK